MRNSKHASRGFGFWFAETLLLEPISIVASCSLLWLGLDLLLFSGCFICDW
jgi:hypothetical protein